MTSPAQLCRLGTKCFSQIFHHRTRLLLLCVLGFSGLIFPIPSVHRIHKWRTRGKKLVPSHESEALEDKQKLRTKTFSELAECLARIPPKITLYGFLFKYSYVGYLLLLTSSNDLLFAIKRDAYIFKETGWFCKFPKHQKLDTTSGRWLKKSGKHVGPSFTLKPNSKARSLQFCKTEIRTFIGSEKKRNKRRIHIWRTCQRKRPPSLHAEQVKSRTRERFIHEAYSFMSVSFYTYLCIYFLDLNRINSESAQL